MSLDDRAKRTIPQIKAWYLAVVAEGVERGFGDNQPPYIDDILTLLGELDRMEQELDYFRKKNEDHLAGNRMRGTEVSSLRDRVRELETALQTAHGHLLQNRRTKDNQIIYLLENVRGMHGSGQAVLAQEGGPKGE